MDVEEAGYASKNRGLPRWLVGSCMPYGRLVRVVSWARAGQSELGLTLTRNIRMVQEYWTNGRDSNETTGYHQP